MHSSVSAQPSSISEVEFRARRTTQRTFLIGIFVFWVAIFVGGMFSPPLMDDADSVHAEAAREMVLGHDWVTLHANGIRYLEKAPLLYWGMAASFKIFGVHDWSARLPLMLGILALLFGTYWVGKRAYGEDAGFYSALILATSVGPYLFTRFLIPDMLVGLWLTLGFGFFLQMLEENTPSRLACWGLAATAAVNVLTKGLIGLVFPGAIILIFLIVTRDLRRVLRMRLLSSSLVFLAIAAPWHIMAALRNPTQGSVRGFLWFYFVNEHFLRYLNKRVPRDYDTVPLAIFWGLILLWLLPWSAFLPQVLKNIPVRLRNFREAMNTRERASLLFAIWAVVILLFFSFSTRQEYYTIPSLPALALLVGGWLQRESDANETSPDRRAGRISSVVLLVVGILAFVAGTTLLFVSKTPPAGTDLADLLKKNPEEYALSFGHIFDLTPQALGVFRGPLLGVSLAFLLGTAANWTLRRRGRPRAGNLALAAMMVVVLFAVHAAFVTFSPILSSYDLAMAIKKHYRAGDTIVIRDEYEQGSTLNYYTGEPVHILHVPSANLWYGSQFPDAPHVFETPESFARLWTGAGTVYLWTDLEHPPELNNSPAYKLAYSGGKYILTNHPAQR